jgi:exopolysaccharide biosynthesis protein
LKQFFQKPFRWAIIYGLVLTGATVFVVLDAFVIPRAVRSMPPITHNQLGNAAVTTTPALSTATQSVTADAVELDAASLSKGLFTSNSYVDENISITISKQVINKTWVYIADIQLASLDYLKTAFAKNTFGRNITQKTSDIALSHNAILAINGDFCGFRNTGFVVRNGVLYRGTPDSKSNTEALVITDDGNFTVVKEGETSVETLLQQSAVQVFSFGPSLLVDRKITVNTNSEVSQAMTSNPRTAIGIISPLHYIFIVSDGRTSQSTGLTLYQLGAIFQQQGCQTAYNLDGGGSSTMWFNGEVVNVPTDGRTLGERKVSDIVYLGY